MVRWNKSMMSMVTGQLILGADKRNPLFTVYGWEEDDGEELLEGLVVKAELGSARIDRIYPANPPAKARFIRVWCFLSQK
jgi:hypothetical protein